MMRFNSKSVVSLFIIFASIHFHTTTAQTSFVVGDELGWTIPDGGAAVYSTWASSLTFMVGDILVFNFTNGKQDVSEVSAVAYSSCTFTNPTTIVNSPASITLTTTGKHYYVCTLANHCKKGQKLSIDVYPADGTVPALVEPLTPQTPSILPTIAPAPDSSSDPDMTVSSPSSSPDTAPTVTSGDTIAPPPPPTSGALLVKTMVSADFLAIGLSFFGLINLRARDFTWHS